MNEQKRSVKTLPEETKRGTRKNPTTSFNYVPPKGDTIPTETLVVQYGYVPVKAQIERMIQAGKELDVFRKEYYDFGDEREIPQGFEDPTRDPNFDPAEAYAYMKILARRVREREKALKQSETITDTAKPTPDPARKDDKSLDKDTTK